MEIISGSSNWKLIIQRESNGITILQAQTCDREAALPEELFGLPVITLAHHALAPGRPSPAGESIQITCGPSAGEWDNRQLETLRLPQSLTQAGDYAFFNCRELKTLHLPDGLCRWGGGALMNCRSLNTFHLTCTGREGELLSFLGDELPGELDVTLHRRDGSTVRLIFPEYTEVYEENVPHHQFDFHILGAGYPYHHCFYQRKLSIPEYDKLWKGFLSMGYDPDCAMRLAWWRLRYPEELTPEAETAYRTYLRTYASETAHWLLTERDAAGLQFLLRWTEWDQESLAALCAQARQAAFSEALALLLEEQHRRFPAGLDKTFDL